MGVVLIAEDMGVWLICNLLQSQDASIQTDVSENRVVSDGSPSLDSPERRLETTNREAIPLMLRSSGSGWATREMGAAFAMAGASYLPWLAGTLEEHPGECQDMVFLNLLFSTNSTLPPRTFPLSLHQCFPNDPYDFTNYERNRFIVEEC